MARSHRSIYQEAEYTSQIPQVERRLRRVRAGVSGALVTSTAAVYDAFSGGRLSTLYNTHVLDRLPAAVEVQIPMDSITPSRLAVAGLYAAVGVIGAVNANRAQSRINHLESMAGHEVQMDRLTTATQLTAGQLDRADAIPEPRDII
jgi:hypothetical protein